MYIDIIKMVVYTCKLCNKEFQHKANYKRHKNKKLPCIEQDPIGCDFCKQTFTSKYNLKRHNKTCKPLLLHNKSINDANNAIIGDNNTIDNSTTNNINISINSYGSEVLNYSNAKYMSFMKRGYTSIEVMNEDIHCNPDNPSNHNIFISNIKSKFIKVFQDGVWIVKNRTEVIEDLIERHYNILDAKFEELSEVPKYKMDRPVFNGFKRLTNDMDNNNPIIAKSIYEDIEMQLYNKRGVPIATSKKLKIKV